MSYPNPRSAVQQYNSVGAQSASAETNPHRLVQMLMEGALDKMAMAKGCMSRGSVAEKGGYISMAISIINGLRASLDKSAGGEIAQNLDDLYDYMERRLLQANLENDVAKVDEVGRLMAEIKSGWDGIAPAAKSAGEVNSEAPSKRLYAQG
jgi:flagellar protein FliS